MLDLILGKGAGEIRQKVSMPPAWSNMTISAMISPPLPAAKSPRIERLYFLMECDGSPAPASHRVVSVRSLGTTPGAVISCTPDLAKRGDGFNNAVRIYDKGTNVKLSVPEHAGGAVFDSWDIVAHQSSRTGVKDKEIKVQLDEHAIAQCNWTRARAAETVVSDLKISPRMLKKHLDTQPVDERTRAQLVEMMESPAATAREAAPAPRDLPIRVEATARSAVIGLAPALEEAEVLEEGKGKWKRINYGGIVGWINA